MSVQRIRLVTALTIAMVFSVLVNLLGLQSGATRARAPTQALAELAKTPSPKPSDAARVWPLATPNGLLISVQKHLTSRGYAPGNTEGQPDLATRAAIFAFQYDHGLALSAEPSETLLEALIMGVPRAPGTSGTRMAEPAHDLVRTVQASLKRLGYDTGGVDGHLGPRSAAAIRAFEAANGLAKTGRVSAPLIQALATATVTASGRLSALDP